MADTPVSMTLSTEVAEAVRLRDAATPGSWAVQDSVYVVAGCWPLGSTICEVIENEPNAALIAAAPSHVDLIERLFAELEQARAECEAIKLRSGELCEKCGWRSKFVGNQCLCCMTNAENFP